MTQFLKYGLHESGEGWSPQAKPRALSQDRLKWMMDQAVEALELYNRERHEKASAMKLIDLSERRKEMSVAEKLETRTSLFKKAERKKTKLKLGISGPSGSGKTYTALLIAKGLGGRVAVIDTENGSASLYSHLYDFDTLELGPPYTTARYEQAVQAAIGEGYDVIITDSISHQWAGQGGLLDEKALLDQSGKGNSFTNFQTITPKHEKFKSLIIQAPVHMICTMRSKSEYILVENDKGRQAPKKVGLAPVQREGMEYEFTTMIELDMNHTATASKDRSGLFDGKTFMPGEQTGKDLLSWVNQGVSTPMTKNDAKRSELLKQINDLRNALHMTKEEANKTYVKGFLKRDSLEAATPEEIQSLILEMEADLNGLKNVK